MENTMTTAAEFLATLPEAFDLRAPGTSWVSSAALAKRIREELALAVKAGAMPKCTWSVRITPGGYTRSLRVDMVTWAGGAVFSDEYQQAIMNGTTDRIDLARPYERASLMYAPAFAAALALAKTIADRHNFDESRIEHDHFHVGYYCNVGTGIVENAARSGIQQEINPEFAALVAEATIAAAKVEPKRLKKILGKTKISTATEWTLKSVIRAASKVAA